MSGQPSKKQKSLFDLGFSKRAKLDQQDEDVNDEVGNLPVSLVLEDEGGVGNMGDSEVPGHSKSYPKSESEIAGASLTDIGSYVSQRLSDEEKYTIFTNLWVPEANFKFPLTAFGKQNRAFQYSYVSTFPWISYSKSLDAAFCKYCFVFQKDNEGLRGGVQQSSLVTRGYRNWKMATVNFKEHLYAELHKQSVDFAERFVSSYGAGKVEALDLIRKKSTAEANRNQSVMLSIIRTVLFLGKQNIPFRGHRDHGRIISEGTNTAHSNEGNFRAMIEFIAKNYSEDLKNHLMHGPSNAMYTSPVIQNEIIAICGRLTLNKIVESINKSRCFSIIADETTDAATIEQLTLCIRYVTLNSRDGNDFVVREDFVGFSAIHDMTGAGISNSLLEKIKEIGIDLSYLRVQSYDGASAMRSDLVGVKTRIQEKFPLAVYTYCSNHCLNLVISTACANKFIRNMFGTVKEVTSFFSRSAKRSHILLEKIELHNTGSKAKGLIDLCDTRWVERHDAIIRFKDLYETVVKAVEAVGESANDAATKTRASILLKAIKTGEFLLSLYCAAKLLSLSLPLSKSLQDPKADLQICYELIENISSTLRELTENEAEEFHPIFTQVVDLCETMEIEVQLPRLSKTQAKKEGLERFLGIAKTLENTEDFYCSAMFHPFLEDFLTALTDRFENHASNICPLLKILPRNLQSCDIDSVKLVHEFYQSDLLVPFDVFDGEVRLWKEKWKKVTSYSKSALESLRSCNSQIYPNVFRLLKILSSLPISVASAERTFSCLRRLKTYLRSTMTEDRLSSLALLNVHYKTEVSETDVLTEFKKKNRKIVLP